jgi:hypothetical protein
VAVGAGIGLNGPRGHQVISAFGIVAAKDLQGDAIERFWTPLAFDHINLIAPMCKEGLARQWKQEVAPFSSIQKMILNPNYQRIIGLGFCFSRQLRQFRKLISVIGVIGG